MPLYTFGSNGSGQLGVGHKEDLNRPALHLTQHLRSDTAVPLMIRAGGNHTIIILASPQGGTGEVWVCGKVFLGLVPETVTHAMPLNSKANFCAATWESVLTCNNSPLALTTWGKSTKGELGRGGVKDEIPFSCARPFEGKYPWVNNNDLKIVDVASGRFHTVVVFSNGEAWAWGANRRGQSHQSKVEQVTLPTRLGQVGFKVKRAVCGREFTYLVGEPQEGRHRILGGLDAKRRPGSVLKDAPAAVPGWKDIGANWSGVFVLLEDGRLTSWGRNDHGQMCPPNLPPIKKIAIGSEHALAIDINDRVLAWGWGEHGNCGPSTDKDGDVKGRFAVIDIPDGSNAIVQGIGAGYSTSWIWTRTTEDAATSGDDAQMASG